MIDGKCDYLCKEPHRDWRKKKVGFGEAPNVHYCTLPLGSLCVGDEVGPFSVSSDHDLNQEIVGRCPSRTTDRVYGEEIQRTITSICQTSGLPRNVIPSEQAIRDAIEHDTIWGIDHLPGYAGNSAQIVLYDHNGDAAQGTFVTSLGKRIEQMPNLAILIGVTHPELGILATIVSRIDRKHDVLYFLK